MDEKFWQRLEETLDKKLEEKLDKKLDEKLNQKFEENNNKLIKIMDEKFEIEHKRMISEVSIELERIVDIIGERIEKVEEKQENILQELRITRKELTARINSNEYRIEMLGEKVG